MQFIVLENCMFSVCFLFKYKYLLFLFQAMTKIPNHMCPGPFLCPMILGERFVLLIFLWHGRPALIKLLSYSVYNKVCGRRQVNT